MAKGDYENLEPVQRALVDDAVAAIIGDQEMKNGLVAMGAKSGGKTGDLTRATEDLANALRDQLSDATIVSRLEALAHGRTRLSLGASEQNPQAQQSFGGIV